MFNLHSLTGRLLIGKIIGLIVGLFVIAVLPTFGFPLVSAFGLGSLMMFVLMGVFLGFVGIFDRHPVFGFKMSWQLRGTVVGLIFMLMFVLLSYENLEVIMQSSLVSWMGLESPFWALLDGVFIGLLMGYAETKFAGEGPDLPLK